jgi:hypothetical protein
MEMFKKKLFWVGLLVIISSCSTVKKLPATIAGASRARFVANWTITNVSYDGLLPGAVQTIFDMSAPQNYVGSNWKLTNSGNGSVSLPNGTNQTIYWSYNTNNANVFQFKKLFVGDSARKVDEGYQLTVSSIDDSQMVLKLPVSLGDKTAYVVLYFKKSN